MPMIHAVVVSMRHSMHVNVKYVYGDIGCFINEEMTSVLFVPRSFLSICRAAVLYNETYIL